MIKPVNYYYQIRITRSFLHALDAFWEVAVKAVLLEGISISKKDWTDVQMAVLFWECINSIKLSVNIRFVRVIVGTGHKLSVEEFCAGGRRTLVLQKWVFWSSKLILSQLAVEYKQTEQLGGGKTGRAKHSRQARQVGQGTWGRQAGRTDREVHWIPWLPPFGNALNCLPNHSVFPHLLTVFKQFC